MRTVHGTTLAVLAPPVRIPAPVHDAPALPVLVRGFVRTRPRAARGHAGPGRSGAFALAPHPGLAVTGSPPHGPYPTRSDRSPTRWTPRRSRRSG
ncbi:hypothetical protein ABZY44_06770 [Streptomyces sp. NPDC006544]|uniref:hypothetical protein n=1 Tax=Streptomyces sp. NPDC006544 TaxID=3154583 RepID=UPI0033BD5861